MDYKSLYKKRVSIHGNDRRLQEISSLKDDIITMSKNSPSFKKVIINDIEKSIFINKGNKRNTKKFQTLPDDIVNSGDIISWSKTHWLVTDVDFDNEVYQSGDLIQCNSILKWQDEMGNIFERYCVKILPSYGTSGNNVVETGNDNASLLISLDKETIKLKRGNRFFIDNNKSKPTVYKISSNPDNVTYCFEGKGYIKADIIEDQYNKDTDNIGMMICDYKVKSTNITNNVLKTIISESGKIIKIRTKGITLEPIFYNGDEIDDSVIATWEVICDFVDKITILQNGNKLTISTNDESLLDKNLKVTLNDKFGIYPEESIKLTIKEIF